jgi:hypothetical protein
MLKDKGKKTLFIYSFYQKDGFSKIELSVRTEY